VAGGVKKAGVVPGLEGYKGNVDRSLRQFLQQLILLQKFLGNVLDRFTANVDP
jgi:hypothetical protein